MVYSASVAGGCPETVQESAPAQSPVYVTVATSHVERTTGAAPEPAAGAGGHVHDTCMALVQLRAAADRDARWPHCVTAVICNGEGGCACTRSEGGKEEEEDQGDGFGCHSC